MQEEESRKAGKDSINSLIPDLGKVGGFPDEEFVAKMWYRLLTEHGVFVHPDDIKRVPHAYWRFLEDVYNAKEHHKRQKVARNIFG